MWPTMSLTGAIPTKFPANSAWPLPAEAPTPTPLPRREQSLTAPERLTLSTLPEQPDRLFFPEEPALPPGPPALWLWPEILPLSAPTLSLSPRLPEPTLLCPRPALSPHWPERKRSPRSAE